MWSLKNKALDHRAANNPESLASFFVVVVVVGKMGKQWLVIVCAMWGMIGHVRLCCALTHTHRDTHRRSHAHRKI